MIELSDLDVETHVDADALRRAVATSLAELGAGDALQFPKQSVPMPGGGFYLMVGGVVPALGLTASKWGSYRASTPGAEGVSTSIILVTHTATGEPAALISGMAATHARTAATAAAIAERLAPEATSLALVGFGPTNRWALEALRVSHPALESVAIAVRSEASRERALALTAASGLRIRVTTTVADAVSAADLAVSATGSSDVLARVADLAPGGVAISLDGATWDAHGSVVVTDRAADAGTERDLTLLFRPGSAVIRAQGERILVDTAGSAVTDVALARVLLDGLSSQPAAAQPATSTEGAPPCE